MVNRQRLVAAVGALIGLAGVAFVVTKLVADRQQFSAAVRQSEPGWLAASGVAALLAIGGVGAIWILILRSREQLVPLGRGARWFSVGQLGKYVPGGIWPVVGQAELARRGGVTRSDAYAGTVLSMVSTLLGAATLAAVTGLASPNHRVAIALLLACGLVVGFGCLAIQPVRCRAQLVVDAATRGRLVLPEVASLATWTALHIPVWCCFAAVNALAVVALKGPHGAGFFVDLAFVTCVSWMAGFVIIGLPGGIGVREAVFVSLMTAPLGAGLAVTVAVIARLVSIVADLGDGGDRGVKRWTWKNLL